MNTKQECWCDHEVEGQNPSCPSHGEGSGASTCSLPDRSELSIRISDALDILDDLERAKVIYGGFAKEQLRRLRKTLKPEKENERS